MLITLLQRHHLWIFVLLSGLSGLALGHLGATTIGMLATPVAPTEQAHRDQAPGVAAPLPLTSYKPILSRNIFNAAIDVQANQQAAGNAPARTASKWTLVGTVSGGRRPLATLRDGANTLTRHLNDELEDGAKLSAVSRNRAELTYPDGQVLILEILQTELRTNVNDSPAPDEASRPGSSETSQLVELVGENQWQIPAQVAEDARSNIGNLLQQAQAFPYLENGQTTGFQIRMIQPGSLIAQLGLEKGDILREVNGVALNSPEKALQIFGQLRQAKQISISLERRGSPMTFAYEIR